MTEQCPKCKTHFAIGVLRDETAIIMVHDGEGDREVEVAAHSIFSSKDEPELR